MKNLFLILKTKYPAIIWTVIIFILCTMPSKDLPNINDKTAHFGVFAIFSFLWIFSTKKGWQVLIFGAIYGILIEFWQGTLPENFHRSFDWYDALADAIGGIIGYFFYKIILRLFPV